MQQGLQARFRHTPFVVKQDQLCFVVVEMALNDQGKREISLQGAVLVLLAGFGSSSPVHFRLTSRSSSDDDFNSSFNMSGSMGGSQSMQPEGIDGWFAVEPAGAISLRLNFSKHL